MENAKGDISKCPFHNGQLNQTVAGGGTDNRDWWPKQLRVDILRQHSKLSDPMDENLRRAKQAAGPCG